MIDLSTDIKSKNRFIPREDISTSTSIKSSIQRSIRIKLLIQLPLLSISALPFNNTSILNHDEEDDSIPQPKKTNKDKLDKLDKKGRNTIKKSKQIDQQQQQQPIQEDLIKDQEGDDDELTLLDVLWPKKEGITLIKW